MPHKLFTVHKLNRTGFEKAFTLAEEFSRLAYFIEENIPEGRERSIAMTHLQDASFHAKRAMAEVPENQDLG